MTFPEWYSCLILESSMEPVFLLVPFWGYYSMYVALQKFLCCTFYRDLYSWLPLIHYRFLRAGILWSIHIWPPSLYKCSMYIVYCLKEMRNSVDFAWFSTLQTVPWLKRSWGLNLVRRMEALKGSWMDTVDIREPFWLCEQWGNMTTCLTCSQNRV